MSLNIVTKCTALLIVFCMLTLGIFAQVPTQWTKKYMSFATSGDGIIAGTSDAGYYLSKNCSGTQFYRFSSSGVWTAVANMPATCPLFTAGIGTRLYVGFKNGLVYYFDSADMIWHAAGNYSSNFSSCSFLWGTYINPAVAINGKIYVVANNSSTSGATCTAPTSWRVWEFNPSTVTWTNKTALPLVNMLNREAVTLFSLNNKLYTGLGEYDGNSEVWAWDPVSNSWNLTTPFPYADNIPSMGAVAYESCNGKAYLMGGFSQSHWVWQYDPTANNWSHEGWMYDDANGQPLYFQYGSTFTLNNKIYVMRSLGMQGYMWESGYVPEITSTVASNSICTRTLFDINVATTCGFNGDNVFTAQLSDLNGSFSNATTIGTLTSANGGIIQATMPSVTPGTGYRVRVISSSPYRVGQDNGANLTVVRTANTSFNTGNTVAYLDTPPFVLSGGIPVGGTYSGPGVTGGNTFNPALAGLGTHTITYTFNSCSAPAIATITVTSCSSAPVNWILRADFQGTRRYEAVSFTIGNLSYVGTGRIYGEIATALKDLWAYNPDLNTWTQKASIPMNAARYGAFSFVIGDKAYVGGGRNSSGTFLKDFWQYHPASDTWTKLPDLPQKVAESSAFAIGSSGYVYGGNGEGGVFYDKLWKWDGSSWSTVAVTGVKPAARAQAVGFAIGGLGYISTGTSISVEFQDLWEFNPVSKTWIQKTDFPGGIRKNAVATVWGTKVYMGMGRGPGRDMYSWDQSTQAWSSIVDCPEFSHGGTAYTNGNGIYVNTGFSPNLYPIDHTWKLTLGCDPVISINYSPNTVFCAGGPMFYLSASALGTFDSGNVFNAQLSDENGVFGSNPLVIGTYASSSFVSFPVTIPSTVSPGNNYRMRIVSSSPSTTSVTTSAPITINSCSIQVGQVLGPLCAGSLITIPFEATGFPSNSEYVAELSNSTGSFASGTYHLGYGYGTGSLALVNSYLPPALSGTQYRIRVRPAQVAAIPVYDNGTDIIINNNCTSLTFDGKDDKVVIPNHTAYQLGSGDFTIEAWVKLSDTIPSTSIIAIVSKRETNTDGFVFGVAYGDKVYYKNASMNSFFSSNNPVSVFDGKCHYIAISRKSGVLSYYIDGIALGTASENASINTTADFTFGWDAVGVSPLAGQINDVRIYNSARTGTEINSGKASYPNISSTNLIGYYNFKEINAQDVQDKSLTLNHGYLGSDNINVDVNDPLRTGMPCYQWDRIASEPLDEKTDEVLVKLYPNPFESTFVMESQGLLGDYLYIEILDLSGRMIVDMIVDHKPIIKLFPALESGVYIVRIKDAYGHCVYKKMIKN